MAQEVDEALRVIAMCGTFIVTLTRGSVFLVSQMLNLRKLLLYSKWEGKENYKKMMKKLRQNGDTARILDLNTQDVETRDRITKMLAENHCLVSDLPDLNSADGHLQIQVASSQMSNVNLCLMSLAEAAKDENHWAYGLRVIPIDEMRYMQTGTTIDGKARPEVWQLFESIPDEERKNLKIIAEEDAIGRVVTYRTTGGKAAKITPQDLREISREMKALGEASTSSQVIVNMKPIDDEPVRNREGIVNGKFFEISATENGSAGKVVFIPNEMLLKYQKAITFGKYSNFIHLDIVNDNQKDNRIRIYDADVFEQLRHGDLTVEQLRILKGTSANGKAFETISQKKFAEILDAAGVIDSGKTAYSVEEERLKHITSDLAQDIGDRKIENEFTIVPKSGFTLEKDPGKLTIYNAVVSSQMLSRGAALELRDSNGRTAAVFVNGVAYRPNDIEYIQRAINTMRMLERLNRPGEREHARAR